MNERLRKLRRTLDLTQAEFAVKIGTSQNVVANYEIGRRNPSRSVVNNICKTFSVNEEWLRSGVGPMFVQREQNEEITRFLNELLADQPDSFRRRFVSALSALDTDAWEAVAEFTGRLVAQQEAAHEEIDIEREVAAYRRQLEEEKRRRDGLSALPDTAADGRAGTA